MILVCAATGAEAAACRAGIAAAGVAGWDVIATGVGPERAARALRRRLARDPPRLVVSSGFAGALSAGVEPLSWITASALHAALDGRITEVALPPGTLRAADGVARCRVVTSARIERRAPAGLEGPVAADMESAALAQVAAAAGAPFAVVRLVTDAPGRSYPELVDGLAAALAAGALPARAVHAARALACAARAPRGAFAFVRDALRWQDALRRGWREHAARGLPVSPVSGDRPERIPDLR